MTGDRATEGPAGAVLAEIRRLATEVRPHVAARVGLDARLDRDLGLDSLTVVELGARLERLLGRALPDEVLATAETPRDLVAALGTAPAAPADARAVAGGPADAPLSATPPQPAPPRPDAAETLTEVLDAHAAAAPERRHIRILQPDGSGEDLTYGELRAEAAVVATGLRQHGVEPGAAVALMLPTGRDYFVAFFAVLLAGAVPTPVYPPARPAQLEEHLRRHARIFANARAAALVTDAAVRRLGGLVAAQAPSLRAVVTVDELRSAGAGVETLPTAPRRSAEATALLQYTSGSTADPKGVVLSHANLLANIRAMGEVGAVDPARDVFVSWLPLYHDMGLIGAWFTSLYFGYPLVVLSPLAFLARPARWLWALHGHQGTVSGGPNFAYELCLRRIDDAELTGLDLSAWRVAFNGAEPVSAATIAGFCDRFAAYGLRREAMTPVYGLAEASLAVTVPPLDRGVRVDRLARAPLAREGRAVPATPDDPAPVQVVGCGRALSGHEVRIVDRTGRVCDEREEGRIELCGPSVTAGYLDSPEANAALFEGAWLDSGDLGYLAEGELYVTGRAKDLVIRAGRNLHPAEIEEAVGELGDVRKGCVAVFAASEAATGSERLVVVAETRLHDAQARAGLQARIDEVVTSVTGIGADAVVLASPGAVPKTSSGKIRRAAARERYERGGLEGTGRAVWWQVARLGAAAALPRLRRRLADVARALYSAYAALVAAPIVVTVYLLVAVLPSLRARWQAVRVGGRVLFALGGVRFTVEGRERLPAEGAYVVAANHASHLDVLVLIVALPEAMVFAATGGLADVPLVGFFARRMGAHLLGGGDRRRGVADAETLAEAVRAGRVVAFYPEGRRTHAPGLEPFRTGAFAVAARTGVPVVPVAIVGTRTVLGAGRVLPRRAPIRVVIGAPCAPAGSDWQAVLALREQVRAALLETTGEPDLA